MENLKDWFYSLYQRVIFSESLSDYLFLFITGLLVFFVFKFVIKGFLNRFVLKSKNIYDNIIFNSRILNSFDWFITFAVIYYFAGNMDDFPPLLLSVIRIVLTAMIIFLLNLFLTSMGKVLTLVEKLKDKPIKGYIQSIRIGLNIIGVLLVFALLTKQSPWAVLSALGALMAILLLIFKDTILSLVASFQITWYDLIQIGDWIEVPQFGADGDVMDVSLHTVKIQNFDKTISVIPTYKLVEIGFKNWRGMKNSGGRRIKRAIFIDQSSVKFCDADMIENLKKFQLLSGYLMEKLSEIKDDRNKNHLSENDFYNGRRLTNLGTFRAYIKNYLKNHPRIHHHLTFLIRQLPPSSTGLPIEIYVFTDTTDWIEYEEIQADIFDHFIAVLPHFDLSVYQYPTGKDFQRIV